MKQPTCTREPRNRHIKQKQWTHETGNIHIPQPTDTVNKQWTHAKTIDTLKKVQQATVGWFGSAGGWLGWDGLGVVVD